MLEFKFMEKFNITTLQNKDIRSAFVFSIINVDKTLSAFYNRHTLLKESTHVTGNITTFIDVHNNRYLNPR